MTLPVAQLIEDNLTVLVQGRDLVRRLDDQAFSKNAPTLALSGVGPHLRHVIDFYERFLGVVEGLDVNACSGGDPIRIDYDARDRDPEMERNSAHAERVIERTIQRVRGIASTAGGAQDVALEVRSDGCPWTPSCVSRELQSLMTHTVHHFALIAVTVRSQGADPGAEFGVAPSTLRHWKAQEERAKAAATSGACAQ